MKGRGGRRILRDVLLPWQLDFKREKRDLGEKRREGTGDHCFVMTSMHAG